MFDAIQKLRRNARNLSEFAFGLAASIVGWLMYLGVFLWFVKFVAREAESLFTLAQISATIAGLTMVAWVVKENDDALKEHLASASRLLLVSTIGFISLGLFFPAYRDADVDTWIFYFLLAVILTSLLISAVTFSIGIGVLIRAIGRKKK